MFIVKHTTGLYLAGFGVNELNLRFAIYRQEIKLAKRFESIDAARSAIIADLGIKRLAEHLIEREPVKEPARIKRSIWGMRHAAR